MYETLPEPPNMHVWTYPNAIELEDCRKTEVSPGGPSQVDAVFPAPAQHVHPYKQVVTVETNAGNVELVKDLFHYRRNLRRVTDVNPKVRDIACIIENKHEQKTNQQTKNFQASNTTKHQ